MHLLYCTHVAAQLSCPPLQAESRNPIRLREGRGCPVGGWPNVVFGSGGGATWQAIDLGCFCVSTAEKEGYLSRVTFY